MLALRAAYKQWVEEGGRERSVVFWRRRFQASLQSVEVLGHMLRAALGGDGAHLQNCSVATLRATVLGMVGLAIRAGRPTTNGAGDGANAGDVEAETQSQAHFTARGVVRTAVVLGVCTHEDVHSAQAPTLGAAKMLALAGLRRESYASLLQECRKQLPAAIDALGAEGAACSRALQALAPVVRALLLGDPDEAAAAAAGPMEDVFENALCELYKALTHEAGFQQAIREPGPEEVG